MPFNSLILTCLSERTGFVESGGRISIARQSNESVLFFVIDEQSNPASTLRRDLSIQGAICDLIVYYEKDNRKTACFIELKSGNVSRAVKQVVNTCDYFRRWLLQCLRGRACLGQYESIKWKAYIYLHGGTPRLTSREKQRLENCFGARNYLIRREENLGRFLRS
jgi:hypothetical protein